MDPLRPNCRYIVTKAVPGFPVGAEVVYLSISVSFDPYLGSHYTTYHFLEGDAHLDEWDHRLDELRMQPQAYFRFLKEVDIDREIALFRQQDPDKYKPKPRPHIP